MNQLLFYLFQVIAASGLLYGYYHFALRNKKFHRYNRFYLLMAVVISTLIPFLNIPVYFSEKEAGASVMLQTLQVISSPSLSSENPAVSTAIQTESVPAAWLTAENVIYFFYLFVLSFFLLRVFISLVKIKTIIKRNLVERIDKIKFINTDEPGTPFSFFRWLFWNRNIELNSEKGEQIFRHELFHIQQKHTWDIIFMEIVSTIFWVNPFFHLIKKELKAIHEFLADEFAIKENKNWQYAELLLMQVFNTNNKLVNPFFHNQIKRRIAMITTSTKPSYRYLRKIMVLPVAVFIVTLFAFNYKSKKMVASNIIKAINPITVVIDAGHGGSDKGVVSKDGKYSEAQLSLEIAKRIQSLASDYNINVVMTREDENFPGGAANKQDALRKRVEIVNKANPDAFISIHISTTTQEQSTRSGFDGYVTNQRYNSPDIQLATVILNELKDVHTTRQEIQQRQEAGVYVIDKPKCPSLLLDCGFINNPNDLSFITKKSNQEDVARSILKGLVSFANTSTSKLGWDDQYVRGYVSDTTKEELIAINRLKNALLVIDGVIQPERGFDKMDSNLILKNRIDELRVFWDKTATEKYGEKGKDGVIEIDTKRNYKNRKDTIPKFDTIYRIKEIHPPSKKSPTQTELNSWVDAKMYGVWIDANRISNSDLKKYKPSDFGWYNVSKLTKTAINYGKHSYQVSLYTQKYYDEKIAVERDRPVILVNEVVLSDTTKPEQPLIVINGNAMPGLTLSAVEKMIPVNDIESITVLKDKTAIDKYGDKGKNGALEIKARKFGPIIMKDEKIKEIWVDGKVVQADNDNKIFEKIEVEPAFPGGEKEWRNYLLRNIDMNIPVKNGAKPGTYTVVVQFVVGKDGSITDVRALTNHGFGMEEEAMRMIKKGPYWIPGIQNGRIVKAYRKQPITFVITKD